MKLSHIQYERFAERRSGVPSGVAIMKRYGSWSAACRDAGIAPGVVRHRNPTVDGPGAPGFGATTFTEGELRASLRKYVEYMDSAGRRATRRGYKAWARESSGAARREGREGAPDGAQASIDTIFTRLIGAGRPYDSWNRAVLAMRRGE